MAILSFNARKIDRLADHKSEMLVVPLFIDHILKDDLSAVDQQLAGPITNTLALGDFSGELGTLCLAMAGNRLAANASCSLAVGMRDYLTAPRSENWWATALGCCGKG